MEIELSAKVIDGKNKWVRINQLENEDLSDESVLNTLLYLKDIYEFFYFQETDEIITYEYLTEDVGFTRLYNSIRSLSLEDRFFIIDCDLVKDSRKTREFKDVYTPHPYMRGIRPQEEEWHHSEKVIDKHFVCHNNREKPSRDYIVDFLNHNNISTKTYLSYHKNTYGWPQSTLLDFDYYNAFCNIVTETFFYKHDTDCHFITEKTEKPIAACMPFISVAKVNHLKYLKEMGFKTFDKWWDESYDSEEDDELRLKKITDVIYEVSNWSLEKCNQVYSEMYLTVLQPNVDLYLKMSKKTLSTYLTNDMFTLNV